MIAPMKKITLLVLDYEKTEALMRLRKAGMLHVVETQGRVERAENILKELDSVEKIRARLLETLNPRGKKTKASALNDVDLDEFHELHARLVYCSTREQELTEQIQKLGILKDQIAPWGDFDPMQIRDLAKKGLQMSFAKINRKELSKLPDDCSYIKLSDQSAQVMIALVNSQLPADSVAQRLDLPDQSVSSLKAQIVACTEELDLIRKEIVEYAGYISMYDSRISQLKQDVVFEKTRASMDGDGKISCLTGFLPISNLPLFKALASENRWGWVADEPTEEDQVPTLIQNKKWVSIIKPMFDIMGTIPGYREIDISMWFLMFFTLFFAMIIGDAAYGMIFLAVAGFMHFKTKKATHAVVLLYVLSIATIIWGALTGTWFGSRTIIASVPLLQGLVIPQIANFPDLFGVTATDAQNKVMQFCFIVGTLQLSLACAMNILRKIRSKNLSAVADFGWLLMIDALYFLVLTLVVGATANTRMVFAVVLTGFILVVLFGAQGPGISFLKGLAGGAAGMFTTFLNSISAFSNIISYIRLFAVGMASLAIAQSFNTMASGMLSGFAVPAGMLVLVIGHGLNLVMGLLSVVVHGVRLNLLEFSGQLGMEWTGIAYDPFRETV